MNLVKKSFCSLILLTILSTLLIPENQAYAGSGKNKLFARVKKGDLFLGGKPPKFLALTPVKKLKNSKTGKYVYMYKAIVRRSGGDQNGQMVLYRARNYGVALAKLVGIDKGTKKVFDTFFPVSIDKSAFPPVMMKYNYKIYIRKKDGAYVGYSYGQKTPKGKKKFVEYLSRGLEPGKYIIEITSTVSLGDHPLKTAYSMFEWAGFIYSLANPLNFVASKIVSFTEWFTVTGFAKNVAKKVLTKAATQTKAKWQLNVLAKVPKLKGMTPSSAVAELSASHLKWKAKFVTGCPTKYINKVYRQNPVAGKKVKKDKEVVIKVCRGAIAPQPTSTPATTSGSYSVFGVDAGPNLYIGKESSLKNRAPGSFLNGGLDYTSKVTYSRLAGPYTSLASAEKALCSGITESLVWGMYAPCRLRKKWKGSKWYWGCESSVQSAIGKYCPQYKY